MQRSFRRSGNFVGVVQLVPVEIKIRTKSKARAIRSLGMSERSEEKVVPPNGRESLDFIEIVVTAGDYLSVIIDLLHD